MPKIDVLPGKTYVDAMNANVKFSAKGQVVIPKDVRDRYLFVNGAVVEMVEMPEGVLLKRPKSQKAVTAEEAWERLRAVVKYDGPVFSDDEVRDSIDQMFREKYGTPMP
ncbi:AbrB/MazE/SpoVT family DNA-binding domain-containing protein [Blastomonas fulva]|uniref:AbrB/MazE/SpoVT family DNA-binding domain-containing protein n=1 Tax=Blastomonas fulva TaxID=1550728 RepID=UPI003F71B63F